jgi:cytochrome oxidase Cu insertion factor (SCO1/SenC/PrrC family)
MRARAWGALAGLAVILVTTAAWWALALVPLGQEAPEWLARTREVCFGAGRDGLPHAGGWLLLIGEPVGMLTALLVGWGREVREGLAGLARGWAGRVALAGTALCLLTGATFAADRVAGIRASSFDPNGGPDPRAIVAAGRMDRKAPALDLVDQSGAKVSIEAYRGRTVLVTFAYAHCSTVCPVIVRDLLATRHRLGADAPQLLIVTLDPWRDPPSRLSAIAREWQLDEGSRVLSGTVEAVELVLSAWQVPRTRNPTTGELIHPAIVYIVNPVGRITNLVDGSLEATLLALEQAGTP